MVIYYGLLYVLTMPDFLSLHMAPLSRLSSESQMDRVAAGRCFICVPITVPNASGVVNDENPVSGRDCSAGSGLTRPPLVNR